MNVTRSRERTKGFAHEASRLAILDPLRQVRPPSYRLSEKQVGVGRNRIPAVVWLAFHKGESISSRERMVTRCPRLTTEDSLATASFAGVWPSFILCRV